MKANFMQCNRWIASVFLTVFKGIATVVFFSAEAQCYFFLIIHLFYFISVDFIFFYSKIMVHFVKIMEHAPTRWLMRYYTVVRGFLLEQCRTSNTKSKRLFRTHRGQELHSSLQFFHPQGSFNGIGQAIIA